MIYKVLGRQLPHTEKFPYTEIVQVAGELWKEVGDELFLAMPAIEILNVRIQNAANPLKIIKAYKAHDGRVFAHYEKFL